MKNRKGTKVKKLDVDLDGDFENYEPSESDDEFDTNERILLKEARSTSKKDEEEVLKVYSSSDEDKGDEDDEEVGEVGSDFDSDIEGKKDDGHDLPDSKAWGKKSAKYYDTDYVDKDFTGFDDEEAALMEEKEAQEIQKRLMSQLENTDFSLGLFEQVEEKKIEVAKKAAEAATGEQKEKIKVDLSKLSLEEVILLLKRQSPEFFPTIKEGRSRMDLLNSKIKPLMTKWKDIEPNIHEKEALEFFELFRYTILLFTANLMVYLILKFQKVDMKRHNILQKLSTLKGLLKECDSIFKYHYSILTKSSIYKDMLQNDKDLEEGRRALAANRVERRKREFEALSKAMLLDQLTDQYTAKILGMPRAEMEELEDEDIKDSAKKVKFDVAEDESEEDEAEEGEAKRGITYQIAKNKGLTPRRKKELRNPRVKHRNKFRKAVIRRKGQVREVRKEINKYGGELFGIKKNVSKSIKLK